MSEHHQTHTDIVKRLLRAEGHMRSVIEMIKNERRCVDVAQQLHAIEKAVCQAKRTLIQDHIDHCLEDMIPDTLASEQLEEFKAITKYL